MVEHLRHRRKLTTGKCTIFRIFCKTIEDSQARIQKNTSNITLKWAWTCDLPLNGDKAQIPIGSATVRPLTLSHNGALIKFRDTTKNLDMEIDGTFQISIHCAQAFEKSALLSS